MENAKNRVTTHKLSYIRINRLDLLFLLLVITPIMDTINGWYVLNHGETGISIGTFYRLFILMYVFIEFRFLRHDFLFLLLCAYFPLSSVIRALLSDISFISAFTYGLKWMLPVIYILLFNNLSKKSNYNIPLNIIEIWKYLIPGILIVEYVLQIGERAYFDAGFRGYFYCTNDIGFSLTMMMIYSLYKFFIEKMSIKSFVPVAINLIAIVILSTKSCLIFTVITFFVFVAKMIKRDPKKIAPLLLAVMVILILIFGVMYENLVKMFARYYTFFSQTTSIEMSFANIMGFLTSARTYRIPGVFSELNNSFSLGKILFGWMPPVFTGAIEMDWLDVFFQHGIIGLLVLFAFYYKLVSNKKYKEPFRYMIVIAMICSCFSGHVINGALPSTVFSVVAGAAIYSCKTKKCDNSCDLYDKMGAEYGK